MRIALIGLAALLPALASAQDASPAPYVLHQGRAVRTEAAAPAPAAPSSQRSSNAAPAVNTRQVSAFGAAPVRTSVVGGHSFARPAAPGARSFRGSSGRRGIMSSRRAAAGDSAPPAYAVPGAKILSEGQQPVYSQAAGGGTHSVEGGGFIAMDQAKAHDVGRAPGITWAPPDTPPGRNPQTGGGGTGASANGPAPSGSSGGSSGPTIIVNNGNTNGNQGGGGNNGPQDNSTGFNPAF